MNIRTATMMDLDIITEIERRCFPPTEAAPREAFEQRLRYYPEHFWLLEKEGEVIAFINGFVSDEEVLTDEMFEKAQMHEKDGKWQMIFGVATLPEYQRKGYASLLMKHVIEEARREKRQGLILTCKEQKLSFYARFGYQNEGESVSEHGAAKWYQMRIRF